MSLLMSLSCAGVPPAEPMLAEYQGPLGPVSIPELLIQKIWLRRAYQSERLRTLDGAAVRVVQPGRWNRLGGPDFRDAVLEIDGQELRGDVEVHFRLADWRAHGHDADPAYDRVVLHVLVFDPGAGVAPARTHSGKIPAALLITPYLVEDLEGYALRDAVRALEGEDVLDLAAPLLALPLEGRRARLELKARERWLQKLVFARQRLLQGWESACHEAALEVLGYRRNRVPMVRLAQRHPLARLRSERCTAAQLFREMSSAWHLRGLRPANHPLRRLEQYLSLVQASPAWPEAVREAAVAWLAGVSPKVRGRRALGLSQWDRRLAALLGPSLGGSRLRTLWLDGLLPLLAADLELSDVWFIPWFDASPGDYPRALEGFLRIAELHPNRTHPLCHGMIQGALKLMIEEGRY